MANTVNLTAPNDFQTQQQAIERQRRLAEALQQQSMEQMQGQTVPGGFYVPPSPVQGLARLAQALVSKHQQDSADQKQSDLSDRQRSALVDGLANYQSAMQGAPAQTFDPDGDGMGPTGTQPAVPGNRQAALAALLRSENPMLQQVGTQMMLKEPEKAKWSTTPHYDQQGNAFILNEMGERKPLDGVKARDKMENVNGVWQNPYAQDPNAIAPADPNKPFAIGPDGKPVANTPYQQYELSRAKAGKTEVNLAVNTEKDMLGNIAAVVGKDVADAAQKARAAVNTISTVNQIRDAINSGKVIAGPGTSARMFLGQIGQVIGVSGKDETEQLTNTRQAIQGLAQLELDGAQQMKGQGQITEGERDIVRRAASGDIDKLTVPEMNTLMNVLDKTSRLKISNNRRNVDRLRNNKNAAPIVDFLNVDEPAAYVQSAPVPSSPATPSAGGGWSIKPKAQ